MNKDRYLFVIFWLLIFCLDSFQIGLDLFDKSDIEIYDDLHVPMNIDYPIFRFYHPDTRTYVSKSNNSMEILAKERFLFSRLIEWEWIPLERNAGIYLRNKANSQYLCFDKYGKPIARERINARQCTLRGFISLSDDKENKVSSTPNNNTGGMDKLKEISDYVNVKLQVIHLMSKFYSPPWIAGFCPNGNSYSNDDPLLPSCHHKDLTRNWSMFYLCPILPEDCRLQMCFDSNHLFDKYFTGCPHRCTYSIQCGGLLTQESNNIEFD